MTFLNWYSVLEPGCFKGLENLDTVTIFESYSILNQRLINEKIDAVFKWMLSFYVSWDYLILSFSENKHEALTGFVKGVDISISNYPKNQLPKSIMDNRGQMGMYGRSMPVENES